MSEAFCKIDIIFKSTKLPLVAKPRPYHLSPPYQTTNYRGTLGWHHVTCPGPLKGRKRAGELIERQHDNASEVQVQQQADGDTQHAPFICERLPLVTFVSSCLQNVNHEAWKAGQACKVRIIGLIIALRDANGFYRSMKVLCVCAAMVWWGSEQTGRREKLWLAKRRTGNWEESFLLPQSFGLVSLVVDQNTKITFSTVRPLTLS